jgi:hypothetical protein
MLKHIFLVAAGVIMLGACSSDQKDVTINFKLQYDGAPFVFFQDYNYPDGKVFNLTRLSFYISDIDLSDGNTIESFVRPIYVDLTNSHATNASAQNGYDLVLEDTELSNITNLNFNIGISPVLNSTTPNDYTSDNDLSRSAEYWMSWNSYIFAKIEGNVDLDGDQVKESGVALHLGSDAALRRVNFDGFNSSGDIDVIIDVKDIFQNQSAVFDIENTTRIHNLSQIDKINVLMDNLVNAISAE